MKLSELKRGQSAHLINIDLQESMKNRLISLGFSYGNTVEFERSAPLGDPQQYFISGNYIAIRKVDASQIEVDLICEK